MATREATTEPPEPLETIEATAVDKGNGAIRMEIPAYIRRTMDLEPGDTLLLDAHRDHFEARPKPEEE